MSDDVRFHVEEPGARDHWGLLIHDKFPSFSLSAEANGRVLAVQP